MTDKFFNSRYPIMEALMNGGSDLTMALAVADAGAFPSYWFNKHSTVDAFYQDMKEFILCTGSSNIVVGGATDKWLRNKEFLKVIKELKISHVEILTTNYQTGQVSTINNFLSDPHSLLGIKILKQTTKLLTRIYDPVDSKIASLYFDAFCIKGKDSAGKSGSLSVSDLFNIQKTTNTNCLIPYGGIGTPHQVRDYINRGAPAVAVGTLLAASKESPLSCEAKEQLVKANSSTLTTLPDTNQNSLILNNKFTAAVPSIQGDWNRDYYLYEGLRGNGNQGLMYVGKGVDHIAEIKPVKEIINYLVSELEYK